MQVNIGEKNTAENIKSSPKLNYFQIYPKNIAYQLIDIAYSII